MRVKELIKSSFEIWCKMRWLKMIDKDLDKAKRLESKASHKRLTAKYMMEEYMKRYGNDAHKEPTGGVSDENAHGNMR